MVCLEVIAGGDCAVRDLSCVPMKERIVAKTGSFWWWRIILGRQIVVQSWPVCSCLRAPNLIQLAIGAAVSDLVQMELGSPCQSRRKESDLFAPANGDSRRTTQTLK
jgi:hypothetical protein